MNLLINCLLKFVLIFFFVFISDREMFEPIFEEHENGQIKMAILAWNKNFLSYNEEENTLMATGRKVEQTELLKIRSNVDPEQVRLENERNRIPEEERGDLEDTEEKYLKKFQSKPDYKSVKKDSFKLIKAKTDGNLHETLLDRREKLKSDKFCK